jgi:mono/diheme cytochrome c family protein
VERGRVALTQKCFVPPAWSEYAYMRAGRLWGRGAPDPDRDAEAYAKEFNRRYGLHPAPYANDGLPMGLRRSRSADGSKTGIQIDCLVCHGGSIGGTSYVGLGNTTLDLHALLADLTRADGHIPFPFGFRLNDTRGLSRAGQVSAFLLSFRNTDLSTRVVPLPLKANLPEMDTPAWWILARKATMYYDGRTDSRAARSIMQFYLGHFNLRDFKDLEPTFQDVLAYLKSLKPPKYPFEIDTAKADRGLALFGQHCTKCHGTYGPGGSYPSRVVELKVIGTDPDRALGLSEQLVAHYNATWFAEEYPSDETMVGYQAPPLDGIWATAPYLHNGSVPTLSALLSSPTRPPRYFRPPSTEFKHFDTVNVGWKVEPSTQDVPPSLPPHEARFLYDTARPGLGNSGHTFGDKLSDQERSDLIEYLKTL